MTTKMIKKKYLIKGKEIDTEIVNETFPNGEIEYIHTPKTILLKLLEALDETPKPLDLSNLKIGDPYWYITTIGYSLPIQSCKWNNDHIDKLHLTTGNIFSSFEEAEKFKKKILAN